MEERQLMVDAVLFREAHNLIEQCRRPRIDVDVAVGV